MGSIYSRLLFIGVYLSLVRGVLIDLTVPASLGYSPSSKFVGCKTDVRVEIAQNALDWIAITATLFVSETQLYTNGLCGDAQTFLAKQNV